MVGPNRTLGVRYTWTGNKKISLLQWAVLVAKNFTFDEVLKRKHKLFWVLDRLAFVAHLQTVLLESTLSCSTSQEHYLTRSCLLTGWMQVHPDGTMWYSVCSATHLQVEYHAWKQDAYSYWRQNRHFEEDRAQHRGIFQKKIFEIVSITRSKSLISWLKIETGRPANTYLRGSQFIKDCPYSCWISVGDFPEIVY